MDNKNLKKSIILLKELDDYLNSSIRFLAKDCHKTYGYRNLIFEGEVNESNPPYIQNDYDVDCKCPNCGEEFTEDFEIKICTEFTHTSAMMYLLSNINITIKNMQNGNYNAFSAKTLLRNLALTKLYLDDAMIIISEMRDAASELKYLNDIDQWFPILGFTGAVEDNTLKERGIYYSPK